MGHKSILHQLNKYKSDSKKLTYETEAERASGEANIPEEETVEDDNGNAIILHGNDKHIIKTTKYETAFKWENILYPSILIRQYEIVYMNAKLRPNERYPTEDSSNKALGRFLTERYNEEYLRTFAIAANDVIKRLVMQRVLVATFNFSEYRYDNLPEEYKSYACEYLSIPITIPLAASQDILENTNKSANLEEKILGRIGYMVIWHDFARPSEMFGNQRLNHGRTLGLPGSGTGPYPRKK